MARNRGNRDRGRDANEDQQRRHQEATADPEHAGDESNRRAHRQDEEDIDRNVGDREVELHARRFLSVRHVLGRKAASRRDVVLVGHSPAERIRSARKKQANAGRLPRSCITEIGEGRD